MKGSGRLPLLNPILELALREDLSQGDCTVDNLPLSFQQQRVTLHVVTRQNGIMSGHTSASDLCQMWDQALTYQPLIPNGHPIEVEQPIALLEGSLGSVLKLERTLLNLLQHLCGVASYTALFVEAIAETACQITHTRKTLPGLRQLESQAVVDGGGFPHRLNVGQIAMIKDNHWQASGMTLPELIRLIRRRLSHTAKLVVEVEDLDVIEAVLAAGADILLLDNFSPSQVKEAVKLIAGRAPIEVSGGITLANVREYAMAGADVISTSAITMGAPPLDLGLDFLPVLSKGALVS